MNYLEQWLVDEVPLKRVINTATGEIVATYLSEAGSAAETSRITEQLEGDGASGGACFKYLYDTSNRLTAVVACPDCTSCNPTDCAAPTQRRLDLGYDAENRLTSWSGGCASCNTGNATLAYEPSNPAQGDFPLVNWIKDPFGNKQVIYHYD